MLEKKFHTELTELLSQTPCHVRLPPEWQDYFARRGVLQPTVNDGRRFVRYCHRDKAILELEQTIVAVPREHGFHCVYTKDISRCGVSFLHDQQLYPGEKPHLWLPIGRTRCMVVWCQRHNEACFTVGASFLETSTSATTEAFTSASADMRLDPGRRRG
jgi:hypothetical protein